MQVAIELLQRLVYRTRYKLTGEVSHPHLTFVLRRFLINPSTTSIRASAFILAVIIAGSLAGIWIYRHSTPEATHSNLLEERLQHLTGGDETLEVFLQSLVTRIKDEKLPIDNFDGTVRTALRRFQVIKEDLANLSTGDPSTAELKKQAFALLDRGKYASVENVLNEASDRELEAVNRKPLDHERRLVAAAEFQAVNANLKVALLAYKEGASYYRRAAEIIPNNDKLKLASYLYGQGAGDLEAGLYHQAETPLTQALSIRRQTLGSEHPDVAMSLQQLAL
jgi:tetratricopeptide (TPR) repeat protein